MVRLPHPLVALATAVAQTTRTEISSGEWLVELDDGGASFVFIADVSGSLSVKSALALLRGDYWAVNRRQIYTTVMPVIDTTVLVGQVTESDDTIRERWTTRDHHPDGGSLRCAINRLNIADASSLSQDDRQVTFGRSHAWLAFQSRENWHRNFLTWYMCWADFHLKEKDTPILTVKHAQDRLIEMRKYAAFEYMNAGLLHRELGTSLEEVAEYVLFALLSPVEQIADTGYHYRLRRLVVDTLVAHS